MKASIVLSTYNGERFIEEQLESIRLQTVPVYEVIISDDCSKDNTVDIVATYIHKHSLNKSWKLIQNKMNKGYERNFLDSCLLATGDIIFFCDQDDIWIPERVEKILSVYKQNSLIQVLGSSLDVFYYEKDTNKWSDSELIYHSNNNGKLELLEDNFFDINQKRSGCTMSVRKVYYEEVRSFWRQGWAHDDFFWKMGLLSRKYANYNYISMKRRMHANNTTVIRLRTREGRIKQLENLKLQTQSLIAYGKKVQCNSAMLEYLKRYDIAAELRTNVVEKRNILSWMKLLLYYRDCFPSKKALFLDLYFVIFKRYRGK